jgi:hypothetical protein
LKKPDLTSAYSLFADEGFTLPDFTSTKLFELHIPPDKREHIIIFVEADIDLPLIREFPWCMMAALRQESATLSGGPL